MPETPPQIKIGAFTIAFLADGLWRNDGGCMFGVVPRELWKHKHPPDEIFDHGDGWLPGHIRALGMEPGDITALIVSHLHFDHAGGIVRRRDSGAFEAAFPRARIFVQRGELEIAENPRNERLHAAYRHAAEILAPVRAMLESIDGDTDIIPGVRAIVTGGHTRDHQAALVSAGGDCFMHMADIVPTRSHLRGPWNQAYDLDALQTMEQKAHYLGLAAANAWWLSFAHDDTVFAAQVKNDRGRYVLAKTIPVR